MAENTTTRLAFLTTHARTLVCIARDPGIRLREIGERAAITERAAHPKATARAARLTRLLPWKPGRRGAPPRGARRYSTRRV